ncbi:MAG: gamma-glutamyltransferase [Gemmataceae bacterium]
MRAAILLVLFGVGFAGAQAPPTHPMVEAKNGMVATVCPIATRIGVDTLQAGGNAVDAAIAIGFAEAVTWPEAGNIGGGGFMLIWRGPHQPPAFIDYREKAPAAATTDLFAKGPINYRSILTTGVPGTVRGFAFAHQKYGKRSWKFLIEPAIKLAREGFIVDAALARRLNSAFTDVKTLNPEFVRVYGKNGGTTDPWAAGDRLILPDLAKTLSRIAELGADGFYAGETAKLVVAEMEAQGGILTAADLASYTAPERTPLRGTYRGHEIIGAPPPSSGGTVILQTLNILENFDLAKQPRLAPQTIHLMAEAMKRGYADRARYLGDPDFVKAPAKLLTKEYAAELAKTIDPAKATPSATLTPELTIRDSADNTTHFSVVDGSGMAVANTYTLENSFGNKIVVRGAGFLLNNEMTDFNPRPGVTTKQGMVGTEPNRIAPSKRMLSSMAPTMIVKDGKLLLVTGSPGGRTIINTVLCILVNTIDYGMDVRKAVDTPRLHHQWFPDRINLEHLRRHEELATALQKMGHAINPSGRKATIDPVSGFPRDMQGDAHTIRIDPKTGLFQGAADWRLGGQAAGY